MRTVSYEIWIMPAGGGYPVLSVFQGVSSPCPADIGVNLGLCILSEDPNEVVWDAPEQFSSQWDIVSLIESRHNPVVALDPNTLDSRISIEIQGHLESVANDRLIGLDLENIIPCQALDGDGNSIELGNVIGPFEPWHPWILMPYGMKLFELNLQLAPNQPIPSTLSQVDFLFDGLYANSLMIVDLPFEVSTTTDRGAGGWLEIATGLKTKITEAEVQDGTLFFAMSMDTDDVSFGLNVLQENASIASEIYGFFDGVRYSPEDF